MQNAQPPNPKPLSEIWRPDLTRLPSLTPLRRVMRWALRGLCRFLVFCCTRATVQGMENFPRQGPALVVINHLGDADAILGIAVLPVHAESLAKIELFFFPVLGKVMDAYGVIWVHRGRPDRRAVKAALEGLQQNRMVCLSPEGRESLTGGLEEGTQGAAYLALKAGVPVVPVTMTGTENFRIYGNLKRLHRTTISLKVGKPFMLPPHSDRRRALQEGTRMIMETLARQLPAEYRGRYGYVESG